MPSTPNPPINGVETAGSFTKFGSPEALDHIRNLTDPAAMTQLLHECIAYNRSLDGELDRLVIAQRTDLDKQLIQLQKSADVLYTAIADSDRLLRNVGDTALVADAVSAEVRTLDMAQSRANSTLQRIDATLERGNCVEGVKKALESEDYESGAKHVETFLRIDAEWNEDSGSDQQRDELLACKERLEGVVRNRLSAAVNRRDHPAIVRFVRVYSSLGLGDEGFRVYLGYLKKVISERSRLEFEHLMELIELRGHHLVDFVACLSNLFKDIVLAIEENAEMLRSLRGEDGIVDAICELQEECGSSGCSLILAKYTEYRKLHKLASEISNTNAQNQRQESFRLLDPRDVEVYLHEIVSLMQLVEDYTGFMVSKIEVMGSSVDPNKRVRRAAESFSQLVQDITGYYVILEGFFMVENVRKAIWIDEQVPESLTTSMVDDVFYVLQTCIRRATSTSNTSSVIAVLSSATNLLSNEYHDTLLHKMREANTKTEIEIEIATALNNVDVSREYVMKLKLEIENQCDTNQCDRTKLKSCLSQLGDTSIQFNQTLNSGLDHLFATIVSPRIRPLLDSVGTISYNLSEPEYADNEANDPWVRRLIHSVETNVSKLQPLMTSANYGSLVNLVVEFIAKRLEVIMMRRRFNQLGGLQLDREVRVLVSHFSGMAQRTTARDKFGRLMEMATVLELEKVSEILELWGEDSGAMRWRLTAEEVKRVMGLRVDFEPEAIAALKL